MWVLDFDYLCTDFAYKDVEHTDLYKLNLKGLKDGEHRFTYELDDAFFQGIEESSISEGDVEAEVVLTKRGELHQLHIVVDGWVLVACDRCLGDLEEDVYSERELIVKFGSEYREESEDVLVIPEREGVLDLHWLLYEDVMLSLPMQSMHAEGECDGDMTALFEQMSTGIVRDADGTIERDEDGVDPRWAALKGLKL